MRDIARKKQLKIYSILLLSSLSLALSACFRHQDDSGPPAPLEDDIEMTYKASILNSKTESSEILSAAEDKITEMPEASLAKLNQETEAETSGPASEASSAEKKGNAKIKYTLISSSESESVSVKVKTETPRETKRPSLSSQTPETKASSKVKSSQAPAEEPVKTKETSAAETLRPEAADPESSIKDKERETAENIENKTEKTKALTSRTKESEERKPPPSPPPTETKPAETVKETSEAKETAKTERTSEPPSAPPTETKPAETVKATSEAKETVKTEGTSEPPSPPPTETKPAETVKETSEAKETVKTEGTSEPPSTPSSETKPAETAEAENTTSEFDNVPIQKLVGNCGRFFLFSEYGDIDETIEAANEWAYEQIFDESSPWYGYHGWTAWTVENWDGEPISWTINFYK